jgi:hypothetical protein
MNIMSTLQISILIANSCMRCAEFLKGSNRIEDRRIVLNLSTYHSKMTTYQTEPTFSQIQLAGHYL